MLTIHQAINFVPALSRAEDILATVVKIRTWKGLSYPADFVPRTARDVRKACELLVQNREEVRISQISCRAAIKEHTINMMEEACVREEADWRGVFSEMP